MLKYTLKSLSYASPDVMLVTLRPKHRKDIIRHTPGQYAALGFRRYGRPSPMRCFSIVNSSFHPEELQFGIKVDGDFTRSLAKLVPGDTMYVQGPFGEFVIDDRFDKNIVLLAGGIGITPFISMLRTAAATKAKLPITLLYSCRSQKNIPFYKELLELEKQNPYLRVIFFMSNEQAENVPAKIIPRRIEASDLRHFTNKANPITYFICGPEGFLNHFQQELIDQDVSEDSIITENFSSSEKSLKELLIPDKSIARWTYGLTGSALLAGIGAIMALDLAGTVPKLAHAASTNQAATTSPTTQTSQPSAAASITTTSQSTTPQNASTTPTMPSTTSQSTYQAPMTSVS